VNKIGKGEEESKMDRGRILEGLVKDSALELHIVAVLEPNVDGGEREQSRSRSTSTQADLKKRKSLLEHF